MNGAVYCKTTYPNLANAIGLVYNQATCAQCCGSSCCGCFSTDTYFSLTCPSLGTNLGYMNCDGSLSYVFYTGFYDTSQTSNCGSSAYLVSSNLLYSNFNCYINNLGALCGVPVLTYFYSSNPCNCWCCALDTVFIMGGCVFLTTSVVCLNCAYCNCGSNLLWVNCIVCYSNSTCPRVVMCPIPVQSCCNLQGVRWMLCGGGYAIYGNDRCSTIAWSCNILCCWSAATACDNMFSVAYGNSVFVGTPAICSSNKCALYYSTNGCTWTCCVYSMCTAGSVIQYTNNQFLLINFVSNSRSYTPVMSSTNGCTWTCLGCLIINGYSYSGASGCCAPLPQYICYVCGYYISTTQFLNASTTGTSQYGTLWSLNGYQWQTFCTGGLSSATGARNCLAVFSPPLYGCCQAIAAPWVCCTFACAFCVGGWPQINYNPSTQFSVPLSAALSCNMPYPCVVGCAGCCCYYIVNQLSTLFGIDYYIKT